MRKLNRNELQQRIDATGMKPFAFAQKHGITFESLRRWIKGYREPKIGNIILLANALGCSPEDISTWVPEADSEREPVLFIQDQVEKNFPNDEVAFVRFRQMIIWEIFQQDWTAEEKSKFAQFIANFATE